MTASRERDPAEPGIPRRGRPGWVSGIKGVLVMDYECRARYGGCGAKKGERCRMFSDPSRIAQPHADRWDQYRGTPDFEIGPSEQEQAASRARARNDWYVLLRGVTNGPFTERGARGYVLGRKPEDKAKLLRVVEDYEE